MKICVYLKEKFETITVHGDNSAGSRKSKIEQIKQGHFKNCHFNRTVFWRGD